MKRFLAAVDAVSHGAAIIGAICLAVMSVLMLAEVVCRNFLHFSLLFSWEYSSYLMGATFFLTAAYALRVKAHVRVSLLAEALPPRANRILEFAATAMGLIIAIYVAAAMVDFTAQSFIRGARTFLPSETYLWPPQGVIALGAVLLALQLVARLIRLSIGEEPDIDAPGSSLPE